MGTLEELYKKTNIVGDCQIWREPVKCGIPRLNKSVWGSAYARQFAYSCSGNPIQERCDLRNICGNKMCVKMEHLTYEPDRNGLLEEFMSKVNKNGGISTFCPDLGECHLWTGAKINPEGHGALNKGKWSENTTHRWIFKIINHLTFDTSVTVNHRCNVDYCVNPRHLYQTPGESFNASNMRQLSEEKRIFNQKINGKAEADIIRAEIAAGARTKDLCEKYKCSKGTIADIKFNRSYK